MTLWITLTMMIAAAAVMVAAPLLRRRDEQRGAAGELEVYRDQIKEVEREAAEGLIDAGEAETAGVEIKRRMLDEQAAKKADSEPLSHRERTFAVIAVAAIVVLGSVGLYAATGRPELPSAEASVRGTEAQAPDPVEQLAAATRGLNETFPASPSPPSAEPQGGLAPVDVMIERLAQRLRKNSNDPEGWRMLGWSYFNTGHFSESATAYARAIELSPDVASSRSSRAEALVRAADGAVTGEARKGFEEALRLDPKDPRARFFLGLAKEQSGDKVSALDDWIAILNEADPNEPSMSDVMQRATELGRELGVDISKRLTRSRMLASDSPKPRLEPADRAATGQPAPSAEDVRSAEAMPPAERMAMIRDMVDRLAQRLEQQPRDSEGWIKLMRSRLVLGETEAAKQVLERALATFNDTPKEQDRISAAARDLGLTP
jgi:cytochrome c-type biogenesis protein CcmH